MYRTCRLNNCRHVLIKKNETSFYIFRAFRSRVQNRINVSGAIFANKSDFSLGMERFPILEKCLGLCPNGTRSRRFNCPGLACLCDYDVFVYMKFVERKCT